MLDGVPSPVELPKGSSNAGGGLPTRTEGAEATSAGVRGRPNWRFDWDWVLWTGWLGKIFPKNGTGSRLWAWNPLPTWDVGPSAPDGEDQGGVGGVVGSSQPGI